RAGVCCAAVPAPGEAGAEGWDWAGPALGGAASADEPDRAAADGGRPAWASLAVVPPHAASVLIVAASMADVRILARTRLRIAVSSAVPPARGGSRCLGLRHQAEAAAWFLIQAATLHRTIRA